ncbi:MAG: hypothetical protein PHX86_08510, partial [Caldisericia bacterium]|nr:hypothetical protein [Caldisericia bacterium]
MAKKNLHKIPKDIIKKVETINSNQIAVGCAIKFKAEDLSSGKLKHLGLPLSDQGLQVPSSTIPPASIGKYP